MTGTQIAIPNVPSLAERIRGYVGSVSGATLEKFLQEAARREIERLEAELNAGRTWLPVDRMDHSPRPPTARPDRGAFASRSGHRWLARRLSASYPLRHTLVSRLLAALGFGSY